MALLLLLLACDSSGSTRVPVVPQEGVWRYQDDGLVSTTCGDPVYLDPDATFALFDATVDGFTIEAGEDVFPCTLDGNVFSCNTRHAETITIPTTDTVLGWNIRVDGVMTSRARMEGSQTFEVDCAGSLCSLAPQTLGFAVPCAYEVAFTAER